MKSTEKTLLILLLLVTFFKGVVWSAFIPIWHTPDEQAHFAQVQYYAETNSRTFAGNDLSKEVYESERLLGTLRDDMGNNAFTYHPEYNIDFGTTTTGIYEYQLSTLPHSFRTEFVKKEAARYPPLFYIISSLGYRVGMNSDIFVRIFLTRYISIIMGTATVWISYLLAKEIFSRNGLLSISIAAFVSFQPMFTFLNAGINNDNLMNLLATILLWLMVRSLRTGITLASSIAMGLVIGLGIITKQLLYPFIPLPILVFGYEILFRKDRQSSAVKKVIPFLFALVLFGGMVFIQQWIRGGKLPAWPSGSASAASADLTITDYLLQKFPQLYRETFPWYWGVFKWLGVVLPLNVLRAIKVAIAISFIGLVKYIASQFKLRKLTTQDWQFLLLIFSSAWYIYWLLMWDFMLIRSIGFSHGLQGRYFFPNLAAHLTLIAFGFWNISNRYKINILKVMTIAMIALNTIGLYTVIHSYYQVFPISVLITQASQYKPLVFKGLGLVAWVAIYIALSGQFISQYLSYKKEDA